MCRARHGENLQVHGRHCPAFLVGDEGVTGKTLGFPGRAGHHRAQTARQQGSPSQHAIRLSHRDAQPKHDDPPLCGPPNAAPPLRDSTVTLALLQKIDDLG
jgi:hypothetical protein